MLMKIVGILSLVSMSASAFAVNRVEDPKYKVNMHFCGPKPSHDECKEDRDINLSIGWITQEEHELLNATSLYTLHTRDGSLRAICPCAGDDDPSQSGW